MTTRCTSSSSKNWQRFERFAQRSPRLYRLQLTLLALAGDAVLTFVQVLPWVLPLIIGALLYGHPWFYWGVALAGLFFVWLLRPSFQTGGVPIARAEAPELYRALDELQARIGMDGAIDVHLDDEPNASASETRGLFGIFGTRRVLTLGIPLLLLLSREAMLAVVAHEFGHFSRRHGRFGHWLYRAHWGWVEQAASVDGSSSALDRASAAFARFFLPLFSVRSFAHSRACEFEADADAASAVGGPTFADALVRVAMISRWMSVAWPRLVSRWQATEPHAPPDPLRRLQHEFGALAPASQQELLAQALGETADWRSTHPPLQERLDALKQRASAPTAASHSAGEELLGKGWDRVLDESERRQVDRVQRSWFAHHLLQSRLWRPLLATPDGVRDWPIADQVARAVALFAADPERGLLELRELHAQSGACPQAAYEYGKALLGRGDAAGVAVLEDAATKHPALRLPAYRELARDSERTSRDADADRWRQQAHRAAERRTQAIDEYLRQFASGKLAPAKLSTAALGILRDVVARDPALVCAWWTEGEVCLATANEAKSSQLRIVAMIARTRNGADEEAVCDRYLATLDRMVGAEAQVLVKTFFEAEVLADDLRRGLEALPSEVSGHGPSTGEASA